MANVPLTVIEDEPFEPDVNVSPVSDPKVSLPCRTVSVSESDVPDAAPSVRLIGSLSAEENVYDAFSRTLAVAGAVTYGLTDRATAAEPVKSSFASVTEICRESWPLKPGVGV